MNASVPIIDSVRKLLSPEEIELSKHLSRLLAGSRTDAAALVLEIVPKYWEGEYPTQENLEPTGVYRPFYYVHGYAGRSDFAEVTRGFLNNVGSHLEGCAQELRDNARKKQIGGKTLGQLALSLKKAGVLPEGLSNQLLAFNDLVYIPSKHSGAFAPNRSLTVRTYSIDDTSTAFLWMRSLSLSLFPLMKASGISLAEDWPAFDSRWLAWEPQVTGTHHLTASKQGSPHDHD
jgi:hypothetical protein